MTPADVATVLTKAAAFDQRTIGRADVAAWAEIISDLNLDDCLAAVTAFYRDPPDGRAQPADIRQRALAIATTRYAGRREPIPDVDPDDPEAWREATAAARRAMLAPDPVDVPLELEPRKDGS